MGVYAEIERIKRKILARGNRVYHTTWRETGAGGITYEVLAYNGRILPHYSVPSTYGTHPHVLFEIPPNVDKVIRVVYDRSSRGARNKLVVQLCRVVPREDGEVALEPIKIVHEETYPPSYVMSLEDFLRIARAVSRAVELAKHLGSPLFLET